jgi:transposase-like protein
MKKPDKKRVVRQEEEVQPAIQLSLEGRLRLGLREFIIDTGIEALHELLEKERTAVCGPRYARFAEKSASRAGHAPGELVMGGRRVSVKRPRARTRDGNEVQLPTFERFSAEDPLFERAVEQMVVGVSTRKYDRSLEDVPAQVGVRGTSKSAVSRRFVAATTARLRSWMTRSLSALDLVTTMIDGVHFAEHVILVALGVDSGGYKHVLGLWEGATENSAACDALLGNLRDRGLRTDRSMLFVIDGSQALERPIRNLFGGLALIQRCRVHKKRNVRDHLPEELHDSVMEAMSTAYATPDFGRAKKLLENLARRLEQDHPGAAASLREGIEETLTLKALGLSGGHLERIFSNTNAIENVVGTGRDFSKRVKRWKGGTMILRWMSTAMMEAEKKFRRVMSYQELPKLIAALRRNDERVKDIDSATQVA